MARSALFPIPPLFPLFFPLFICVKGACLLRNLGAHGWVLPGICAVQDVSGTQPSLTEVVVKQDLPSCTSFKIAEHGLDPTLKNAHFQNDIYHTIICVFLFTIFILFLCLQKCQESESV